MCQPSVVSQTPRTSQLLWYMSHLLLLPTLRVGRFCTWFEYPICASAAVTRLWFRSTLCGLVLQATLKSFVQVSGYRQLIRPGRCGTQHNVQYAWERVVLKPPAPTAGRPSQRAVFVSLLAMNDIFHRSTRGGGVFVQQAGGGCVLCLCYPTYPGYQSTLLA